MKELRWLIMDTHINFFHFIYFCLNSFILSFKQAENLYGLFLTLLNFNILD